MNELDLKLRHVKKSYLRPVLKDISLTVNNHSFITIIGKSGSGKSTLMNIIGLIERFDEGEFYFNGANLRSGCDYSRLRLENIGFIFQSYNLIPTLSCQENILLPTLYHRKRKNPSDFDELVSMLEIEPLLSQRVNTLSGGEKQRVAIARALTLDPCLLLADEPTGNLDPQNKSVILNLLQRENQKGRGIILITHDYDIARMTKTVYQLKEGVLSALEKRTACLPCGQDAAP